MKDNFCFLYVSVIYETYRMAKKTEPFKLKVEQELELELE